MAAVAWIGVIVLTACEGRGGGLLVVVLGLLDAAAASGIPTAAMYVGVGPSCTCQLRESRRTLPPLPLAD